MPELSMIPLGGMGKVTQNMYLYMFEKEILIVDCGIGFPDIQQPGADILIPDTQYLHELLDKGYKIVGMILTHGHDDHIAATPYILPEFPDDFPIFGSPLTAGFAEHRMSDGGVNKTMIVLRDHEWYKVGDNFEFSCHAVTHSVPDTKHFFIRTPQGMAYHGTDFKIDKTPVDGVVLAEDRIREVIANEPVMFMTMDCLRVERRKWVPSESATGPVIHEQMVNVAGKVIVTLMSSHIHRIQQVVDATAQMGRKVAFVGRSVEQNVQIAQQLELLHMPHGIQVDKRDIADMRDDELVIIIAGSQGQEGSSLVRAVYGEHRAVQITNRDKVIFSADAIPGNEIPYYQAIDELSRNGVDVVYPDIVADLHESGHASAEEQKYLLDLIHPDLVMPIGGADRHRAKFLEFVADEIGFARNKVVLPKHGEVISIGRGFTKVIDKALILPRIVDGLGIGDVGPKVLSERKALGGAGMIVVIVPRHNGVLDVSNIRVISRGFVFLQEAQDVIRFIEEETKHMIDELQAASTDNELLKKIERKLAKKLYAAIRREPMIIAEILEM